MEMQEKQRMWDKKRQSTLIFEQCCLFCVRFWFHFSWRKEKCLILVRKREESQQNSISKYKECTVQVDRTDAQRIDRFRPGKKYEKMRPVDRITRGYT